MNWRDRIALLLGVASPFTFNGQTQALADQIPDAGPSPMNHDRDQFTYSDPAIQRQALQLAAHRSHSSHASHVSGSGSYPYSSSSGYVVPASPGSSLAPSSVPQPLLLEPSSGTSSQVVVPLPGPPLEIVIPSERKTGSSPLPAPKPAPSNPGETSTGRMTKDSIVEFIRKMQIALIIKGYDPGPVDGTLNDRTKSALSSFQQAVSLPATGLMDVTTLKRLGVLPQ